MTRPRPISNTWVADTLVRDHGLPFRSAHAIAALLLKARTEDPGALLSDALSKASRAILGRALDYTEQQLETIMSPRHFVEVRTTYGGPAPSETARALSVSRTNLAGDKSAWQQRRDHVATAERTLRERVAAL